MRIRLISYTKNGRDTAERITEVLTAAGHNCRRFSFPKYAETGDEPLTMKGPEWAGEGFREADALVFCCASGIAVRAIAPWVKDKTTDPAVIVTDDAGQFIIPLLSGHLGGANELALLIAEKLQATPVLTTATDVHGLFAVDVFAKKNHLRISDMKLAKEVSAALLSGEPVSFRSDLPWEGPLPKGLTDSPLPKGIIECSLPKELAEGPLSKGLMENNTELGIWISSANENEKPFPKTLQLIPMRYAAGIGCRRGKTQEELAAFLQEQLAASGITYQELRCIASIDLKKDEQGLIGLSESLGVPFLTFTSEELMEVPGTFTLSEFVKAQTGVDSVCERAAVKASGGTLIRKKTAANGMTFALAAYEEAIRFE